MKKVFIDLLGTIFLVYEYLWIGTQDQQENN